MVEETRTSETNHYRVTHGVPEVSGTSDGPPGRVGRAQSPWSSEKVKTGVNETHGPLPFRTGLLCHSTPTPGPVTQIPRGAGRAETVSGVGVHVFILPIWS